MRVCKSTYKKNSGAIDKHFPHNGTAHEITVLLIHLPENTVKTWYMQPLKIEGLKLVLRPIVA